MKQIEYQNYSLSFTEFIFYGLLFFSLCGILSFLFYDSFIPVFFMCFFLKYYYKKVRMYLCDKRKQKLILQFRDMIHSISVSLNSGYSIENAIMESYREMEILYGNHSYIHQELSTMLKKLSYHIPVETVFLEFAERTKCDDILIFSQILMISKRNGGDLISMIKNSAETIGSKIDMKREIDTAISSKKFEQTIMFFMPIAIMMYIRIFSKGYFTPVYHNITGICLMTFCLVLYCIAVLIGLKISDIKI